MITNLLSAYKKAKQGYILTGLKDATPEEVKELKQQLVVKGIPFYHKTHYEKGTMRGIKIPYNGTLCIGRSKAFSTLSKKQPTKAKAVKNEDLLAEIHKLRKEVLALKTV